MIYVYYHRPPQCISIPFCVCLSSAFCHGLQLARQTQRTDLKAFLTCSGANTFQVTDFRPNRDTRGRRASAGHSACFVAESICTAVQVRLSGSESGPIKQHLPRATYSCTPTADDTRCPMSIRASPTPHALERIHCNRCACASRGGLLLCCRGTAQTCDEVTFHNYERERQPGCPQFSSVCPPCLVVFGWPTLLQLWVRRR